MSVYKAVKDKRPVNLNIFTFRLPLTAYASISHRISGGAIFFGTLVLMVLLDNSLSSEAGFQQTLVWLDSAWVKLIVWAVVAGYIYHSCAGIKHLIMDAGIGETMEGGMTGAKIVIGSAVVLILLAGIWIW